MLGCLLLVICGLVLCSTQAQDHTVVSASSSVDPDKAPSELNHHLAGFALIGVGLVVLAGLALPNLSTLQLVWPSFFIGAGVFLAAWSDAEIWPRGNLSWMWLLHHDAEARQHKIYAVLLIALGLLEYLRNRGVVKGFWRVGAFPILAVVGASLLLFHDHGGTSGVRNPEVRNYLVNPALDVDGKPWPADSTADPHSVISELSTESLANARTLTAMASDAMSHPSTTPVYTVHPEEEVTTSASGTIEQGHAGMNHSSMAMDGHGNHTPGSTAPDHSHHMSASMRVVQREHFWFMIVGLGIAMFKLLSDAGLRYPRFIRYCWPSATIVLGVLLTLYRE